MLTDRGRSLLALGGLTYLGAWAFGGRILYPVAVGLVLAVAGAALWVRLLRRPMRLRRALWRGDHLAGDDVHMGLEVDVEGWLPPVTLVAHERLARLGETETRLHRTKDGALRGGYILENVPRGRYPVESSRVVLEDPFGLERVEIELVRAEALLVLPRLVELDELFTDEGGQNPGGRNLVLRRTTGYELHSVREYAPGDSLRRVHWPSTARRRELMVKELEDAPRDESAVFLDADAAAVIGEGPDTTFELGVRAAGSIVRAHARRGRRTSLIVSSAGRPYQRVYSFDGDWTRALELLAAVEPDGHTPAATFLADEAGAAARALELTVVTARVDSRLADRLLQRALSHHAASLVYVDPATFVEGGRRTAEIDAQLLRLDRAGIPVVVVHRGEDLAARLSGTAEPQRGSTAVAAAGVAGG
jgi:uncharacterized protein (DUF58 family)